MTTNTLETAYSNGQIIDASHINELTSSLLNQVVGRNSSGVPEAGKSLGTAALPWGAIYGGSLVLNGEVVDTTQITSLANRIVSGKTRLASEMLDFLKPDGAAAEFTLEGAATDIVLSINGAAATVNTDIVKTGLTLAPAASNTCQINDGEFNSGVQNGSKYAGESDYMYGTYSTKTRRNFITLDTMGANVVPKVGQWVAFKRQAGSEILFGFLESTTKITNVYRGYFFDDSAAPISRETMFDNDVLEILEIGYVFVEDNGTTVDISYLTPSISNEAPSTPATGQYWFDITNQVWKRYSGISFEIINRVPVGMVVMDDTACIASRTFDVTRFYGDRNNIEIDFISNEVVRTINRSSEVEVYGKTISISLDGLSWNITTDLDSGIIEANSTLYYLYIDTRGKTIISDVKPYYRPDLGGAYYHPYESYRCVGEFFNNGGGAIGNCDEMKFNKEIKFKDVNLVDQRGSGTNGGSGAGSTWNTRVLNTTDYKINGNASPFLELGANQMALMRGIYYVKGKATVTNCNRNKLVISNPGPSLFWLIGMSQEASNAGTDTITNHVEGYIIINDTEGRQQTVLNHWIETAGGAGALTLGRATSIGLPETFAMVHVKKVG